VFENAPEVDFGSWSFFAFPGMCVYLVIAWCWLCYYFLNIGLKDLFCSCCGRGGATKSDTVTKSEQRMTDVIRRQYKALGPMSFAECAVLFFFTLLALLWVTRDPGFIAGWGSRLFEKGMVSDATVAMTICFILFVFPSRRPNFLCFRAPGASSDPGPVPPLLAWNVVQSKMAWNVILLLGGSFAMAAGSKESGLSKWIGSQMTPLANVHPLLANICCLFVICALTQCTSNTATATLFLPILAELGEVLHVHPLYLMLPATLITSYAFMLPVSTPPNAIAYSYGHLNMMDMVKAGSFLNILGFVIAILSVSIFGPIALDTNNVCPDWLESEFCLGGIPINNTTNITYDMCLANGVASCNAQFNLTEATTVTALLQNTTFT
jgi:sodium-dependent dicarboxylate transporter 2/3/5